jgi:hypothetical protein
MRRSWLVVLLAFALVAVPGAAFAKGASKAQVKAKDKDKGVFAPITFRGNGEPGDGSALAELGGQTGIYSAMFPESPSQMLSSAPTGDLGPSVTVTYTIPGPAGGSTTLDQDLYPYAAGGPVTFTAPGQSFLGGEKTVGGWFRAPDALTETLAARGFPSESELLAALGEEASAAGASRVVAQEAGSAASTAKIVLMILGGLLAGAALVYVTRQRPKPTIAH